MDQRSIHPTRSRWAALGAAVAVTLGAGGMGLVAATSPGGAATFVPIDPCRLADTRPAPDNVGPRATPIGADETLTVAAVGDHGRCTGIPGSATGLALNVTAVRATQQTFLTIWGSGDRPHASQLNPAPGEAPTPNAVTTGLTASGAINVYNRFGDVHVVVDIVGYYTDHHHDDRYFTKSQTELQIAVASDVIHLAEHTGLQPVYEPTGFLHNMTFETTAAGSALIMFDAGTYGVCPTQSVFYYIVVDGEPVVGSALYDTDLSVTPRRHRGVVDQLPAGDHTAQIGMECVFGGSVGGKGAGSFEQLSVVVVP